jgi:hypothetical protein
MAYNIDKTGKITINGFEKGIGVSPLKGIGNIQAGNITTEPGEVMCNFARTLQSQPVSASIGTLTQTDSSHLTLTAGISTLTAGIWINISASTISGLATGNYWISTSNGTVITVSSYYNSATLGSFGTGTASFTLLRNMGNPIASATEKYCNGTTFQYRYYILEANSLVWVYDTAISGSNGFNWFLPDYDIATIGTNATGITVLNGWILVFAGNTIWCKSTVNLGNMTVNTTTWASFSYGYMQSPANSPNPHYALTGHQGKTYYTDGNFIGSIYPRTSLLTSLANIQSYAKYTAVTTVGTLSTLIGGSVPYLDGTIRVPTVFFSTGTQPTNLTAGTIYYILYATAGTFSVFSAASGGVAIDIASGAAGDQYFNTFFPTSAGGKATITFTPQHLNLPFFETTQSLGECGNLIFIGCKGNVLYPWNQIDPIPGDLIPLPENNVVNLVTVNNMLYIWAGARGNIYVTNGSTASLVLTVPDYCAGVPGTPSSYIEPYFIWGGAMYLRGRVWFSILDQTSGKAGNCGGIWSFVPTQNFWIGQDTGLSLRCENQSSYGSYSGVCNVLLPAQNQNAKSPQYWSGWQNSYDVAHSTQFGIDFTSTTTSTPCIVETDLIPTGTLTEKKTFERIEYKLSTDLSNGGDNTPAIKYRQNSTDAWVSCGTAVVETSTLSGYFPINFEKGQWLQLQVTLTPLTGSTSSFVRLTQIIVV